MNLTALATKLKAAGEACSNCKTVFMTWHQQGDRMGRVRPEAFIFHFYETRNSGPKISYRKKLKSILYQH